ncbi:unnamed protein product, partial [Nesidiocoris tenuis]
MEVLRVITAGFQVEYNLRNSGRPRQRMASAVWLAQDLIFERDRRAAVATFPALRSLAND